jgi:outer membrane lipoprotein carrier protein
MKKWWLAFALAGVMAVLGWGARGHLVVPRAALPAEGALVPGMAPTTQEQVALESTAPDQTGADTREQPAAVAAGVASPADLPAGGAIDGPAAARPDRGARPQPADHGGSVGARPESVSEPAVPSQSATEGAAILRRTASAYENARSIKAEFVQEIDNPVLGNRMLSRGTLYQRRPDRFLMRFSEPAGDVIVSDGEYFWVYYPSVDVRQVMRAPAGQGGAGGVDLFAQFLGDPASRFDYTVEGSERVAGRDAYVLTLVPKQRGTGYRRLKVWLDKGDHMARRFEIMEDNGNVRHFELSGLEVNQVLPDSLFRFTPPPDARIIDR